MKKILISILIILLLVLAYVTIFEGLVFGKFSVLSVKQIRDANDSLTREISQTKTLLEKNYPSEKEELSASVQGLLEQKEEYYKLAKISTEGEISQANTEETFLREYLWTRIGRYATTKGVNMTMNEVSSNAGDEQIKNLQFTVTGYYAGIVDFISAIENDENLHFKVENYNMVSNETNLTATFVVRNVRIKAEQVTTVEPSNNETEPVSSVPQGEGQDGSNSEEAAS